MNEKVHLHEARQLQIAEGDLYPPGKPVPLVDVVESALK